MFSRPTYLYYIESYPDLPVPFQYSVAYSILTNVAKRAQYDRDRLEYLYTHFAAHAEFPAAALARAEETRDEQIQVYAATLDERVRDPIEEKKAAVQARAARTRADLDEYNERSDALRQDWATSPNEVLRMAGNALREIVVCAEEDLLMLEDELGRLEGILAPADRDGPAGRVTSGQYGSDVGGGGGGGGAGVSLKGRHTLLASQRVPSVPRSPTVPLEPKSASKLGVQGEDSSARGDSSEEDPSPAVGSLAVGDRIRTFLLGPTGAMHRQPVDTTTDNTRLATITAIDNARRNMGMNTRGRFEQKTFSSLFQAPPTPIAKLTQQQQQQQKPHDAGDKNKDSSPSPSTFHEVSLPPAAGSGMGLVEWQLKNGTHAFSASDDSPSFWDHLNFKPVQIFEPSPQSTSSIRSNPYAAAAADASAFIPQQDFNSVEPLFRRPNRQLAARHVSHAPGFLPTPEEEPFLAGGGPGGVRLPSQSYGFHVTQPLGRQQQQQQQQPSADAVTRSSSSSNVPVPGVGKLPTAKQCVAIKDFQVRVWKRATGNDAAEDEKEKVNAAKVAPGGGAAATAPQTKQEIEKTREEFKRQIAERAALNAARGSGQAKEGGDGTVIADDEKGKDVFRRTKSVTAGHPPTPDMDDPFI